MTSSGDRNSILFSLQVQAPRVATLPSRFILYRRQMAFFVFAEVCKGRLPSYVKNLEIKKFDLLILSFFLYYMKQVDSMLQCVCLVIDHVIDTPGYRLVCRLFSYHSLTSSVILLLNRHTATWNLFVKDVRANSFCASLVRTKCARHVMHRVRALSSKVNNNRANGPCYNFA